MASEVFIDAGAWYALVDKDDMCHKTAAALYPTLLSTRVLVTTNLVVAEVHVLIRRRLGYIQSERFLENVSNSPRIDVVYATRELESAAKDILRNYADQPFSYADAVSFACMRARGIQEAFAFDKHFAIAGFRLLPGGE